jgi:hypothetical protein
MEVILHALKGGDCSRSLSYSLNWWLGGWDYCGNRPPPVIQPVASLSYPGLQGWKIKEIKKEREERTEGKRNILFRNDLHRHMMR